MPNTTDTHPDKTDVNAIINGYSIVEVGLEKQVNPNISAAINGNSTALTGAINASNITV